MRGLPLAPLAGKPIEVVHGSRDGTFGATISLPRADVWLREAARAIQVAAADEPCRAIT